MRMCPNRLFRAGRSRDFSFGQGKEVGWEVEFGDWHGFIESIEKLVHHVEQRPKSVLDQIEHLSVNVRKRYSQEAMIQSVEDALLTWESQLTRKFLIQIKIQKIANN